MNLKTNSFDEKINHEKYFDILTSTYKNQGLMPVNALDGLPQSVNVMVASMLRSGSTFVSNTLACIANLTPMRYCDTYFNVENELSINSLLQATKYNTISLSHTKANINTCDLINKFNIKPIIVVRNIYETTAELARYYRSSTTHPNFLDGYSAASMAWVDNNINSLSDIELLDFIIDMYIPWHISFYVSWIKVMLRKEVTAIMVLHKRLKNDPDKHFKALLNFCNLSAVRYDWENIYQLTPPGSHDSLRNAQAHDFDYWKDIMTCDHKQKLLKFCNYYPDVDFSLIYQD